MKEASAEIMTTWEVELTNDGKWHCYHSSFSYELEGGRRLRLGIRKGCMSCWVVEANSRSQALSIAKRDYGEQQNLTQKPGES